MMNGDEVLNIQGLSVNLPIALFGTKKDARCISGTCGSVSNGHWAIFSGSPDLSLARKAAEKRARNGEIVWEKGKTFTLADIKGQTWDNSTNMKESLRKLYYGRRYALVDDYMVINNKGTSLAVHGYLPMTWVGENEYKAARKEMDVPYEVWFDPKYYIAFRKLGFDLLVGPGDWEKKVVGQQTNPETGETEQVIEDVHKPQVGLLVKTNQQGIFEVRGCLMPMSSP